MLNADEDDEPADAPAAPGAPNIQEQVYTPEQIYNLRKMEGLGLVWISLHPPPV